MQLIIWLNAGYQEANILLCKFARFKYNIYLPLYGVIIDKCTVLDELMLFVSSNVSNYSDRCRHMPVVPSA